MRSLKERALAMGRGGVAVLAIVVLVAAISGAWWWMNRPPETIRMEGAIVILDPKHYVVAEDGQCLGTRSRYMGGADVVIESAPGEFEAFVMEPGVVDSGACRLAFTGEVTVAERYTAYVAGFELQTLEHGPIERSVGTGETDETFLRADFIADRYDPWGAET